ncbi:MAG: quinate 5-dehydrogenase [Armatimonadetes bacterium]|nr:quinate 5-dehydrogenase [Armatimonadota bacterium]
MAGDNQNGNSPPLRVVSVSLGAARRDHRSEVTLLGRRLSIERVGVDGDFDRACAMIRDLDGKVAAIGLGGTDLYLVAGKRRYVIEESRRLAEAAKVTPVVDGSGLKNTLERETIRWLAARGVLALKGKKVLVVSAVDRFGMAEAFTEAGSRTLFGDLIFALGLPIPMRSLRTVRVLAALLLPILRRLPIRVLYPTGSAQESTRPKHARFFRWADVIAGDFHYIRRHLPEGMDGKTIITNTTTREDVAFLRQRGIALLVTTTPEFEGRSFGTNVMEGVLVALAGKRPEAMQPRNYLDLLRQLGWQPAVQPLEKAAASV